MRKVKTTLLHYLRRHYLHEKHKEHFPTALLEETVEPWKFYLRLTQFSLSGFSPFIALFLGFLKARIKSEIKRSTKSIYKNFDCAALSFVLVSTRPIPMFVCLVTVKYASLPIVFTRV